MSFRRNPFDFQQIANGFFQNDSNTDNPISFDFELETLSLVKYFKPNYVLENLHVESFAFAVIDASCVPTPALCATR